MSTIRILPDEIANRIAAGEVVERPASVVKELVENAIDAGATRVQVEVQEGGRRSIQVSDDGCGMDEEDALLAIEAHATSKIRESFDIDRITTLGFRGEALPSIAAVSHFRMCTRRADDVSGVEVTIEGGALRDVKACGCAPGTSVRVRNLFFNLPARRKFLRQSATEDSHTQETVLLQALANPTVAFDLRLNDQQSLRVTDTGDTGARIAMLLGRETYDAMLPVAYDEADIAVRGYVARPGVTRSSRKEQRTFVNGRPAQADVVFFAIREAYHTMVMKGRYPPVVLYLELPAEAVDVNVHPTKREVRFRDGRLIGRVVAAAVRRALQGLLGAPVRTQDERLATNLSPAPGTPFPAPAPAPAPRPVTLPMDGIGLATRPSSTAPLPDSPAPFPTSAGADLLPAVAPAVPGAEGRARAEILGLRVLGGLRSRYWVAEGISGLVLIDRRAAHERILFEQLLAASRANEKASQPLLLPVTVELSPADAGELERGLEDFARLGFAVEPFGGNTYLVSAIPAHFQQEDVAGMLRDMLADLRQGGSTIGHPDEIRIAQVASHHAIRSEEALAEREVTQLLQDLAATEMPYTSPQGRPVMVNIPFGEVEKRFNRR